MGWRENQADKYVEIVGIKVSYFTDSSDSVERSDPDTLRRTPSPCNHSGVLLDKVDKPLILRPGCWPAPLRQSLARPPNVSYDYV